MPQIFYQGYKEELTEEELAKVKNAINSGYGQVDLVRGTKKEQKRIKLNLTNYIKIES